jgi:pimeloyl-ACP methyl ester carboxylesterase
LGDGRHILCTWQAKEVGRPYTKSDGVRIHYEVIGDGPPLVLHHWTFSSLDGWNDLGYVDALRHQATLILIDSRGHGASDKPTNPKLYTLEARGRDVTKVLDELGIRSTHFFGFSMGGWIGYGMAVHAQERLCSLAIGGAHPFVQSMQGARDLLRVGVDRGATAFLNAREASAGPVTPEHRARILQYNFRAMVAAARDRDDLGPRLDAITVPCLLMVGEEDGIHAHVREASEQIANANLVTFPGKDHGGTIEDVERVVPLVVEHIVRHSCSP